MKRYEKIIVNELQEKPIKLKPYIRAQYTGPSHFLYSGQYPKKQELCIEVTGWLARIIGFVLRATQY